jgi:protein-tyrosine phosphatase
VAIAFPRIPSHLPVTRLANLRDLGGHQARAGRIVRTGRVYRSDSLHLADDADWVVLNGLGIRTLVDLRTQAEAAADPVAPDRGDLTRFDLPVLHRTWAEVGLLPGGDPVAFLAARYIAMLEEGADAIARALRVLADATTCPVVLFCTVGKDRAGVVAAVVLGALGVPDELIIHDYIASDGVADSGDAAYRAAPPEAMAAMLGYVHTRYRSMVGYARSIGVEVETIEALHEHLLV